VRIILRFFDKRETSLTSCGAIACKLAVAVSGHVHNQCVRACVCVFVFCIQNDASKLLLAIMESRHDSENAERILYNIQLKQLVSLPIVNQFNVVGSKITCLQYLIMRKLILLELLATVPKDQFWVLISFCCMLMK
jgi:hypothetical protein